MVSDERRISPAGICNTVGKVPSLAARDDNDRWQVSPTPVPREYLVDAQQPLDVSAEDVVLVLLGQAFHLFQAGGRVGIRGGRVRIVAAQNEILAANRGDRCRERTLIRLSGHKA